MAELPPKFQHLQPTQSRDMTHAASCLNINSCQNCPSKASNTSAFGTEVQMDGSCLVSCAHARNCSNRICSTDPVHSSTLTSLPGNRPLRCQVPQRETSIPLAPTRLQLWIHIMIFVYIYIYLHIMYVCLSVICMCMYCCVIYIVH